MSVLIVGACKSSKRSGGQQEATEKQLQEDSISKENVKAGEVPRYEWDRNLIVDEEMSLEKAGDYFGVTKFWVDGDTLRVKLNYSGGCETHGFKLYSNRHFLKSMPPKLKLILWHDGKKDAL